MSWRDESACRDLPVDLFYPAGAEIPQGRPPHPDTRPDPYAWARQICHGCPVKFLCLKEAVETNDTHGFRGGLAPTEIHAIIHGEGRGVTKQCDWCGAVFTLGKFHNNRTRFCGQECGRAADRAVWRDKRRERGGRAGAA